MENKNILIANLIDNERERFSYFERSPRTEKTDTDQKIVDLLINQQRTAVSTIFLYALFPEIQRLYDHASGTNFSAIKKSNCFIQFAKISNENEMYLRFATYGENQINFVMKVKISTHENFKIIYFDVNKDKIKIATSQITESNLRQKDKTSKLLRRIHYSDLSNIQEMSELSNLVARFLEPEDTNRLNSLANSGPVPHLTPFIMLDNYTIGKNTLNALNQSEIALKKILEERGAESL